MTWAEIPLPPSTNDLWTPIVKWRRDGRPYPALVRSKQYEGWIEVAVLLLRVGLDRAKDYPVRVVVEVTGGKGWPQSRRDVSNVVKATEDALVKAQRIEDDSTEFVHESVGRFVPGDGKATCRVAIEPMGDSREG